MKFHAVFLVQSSHNFNFFDQALFPLVFAVGGFLGKGFNGKVFTHLQLLCEIDRSKVALAYFLFRFELLMKTFLVYFPLQNLSGRQKISLRPQTIMHLFVPPLKLQS